LNLNSVVVEMGKLLQRTIGEDIQLQLSLATDLGLIKADPGEIGQVLLNLAINAKDAMPSGGSLFLATSNVVLDASYLRTHLHSAPGEYILLNVTDTGCGMDATTAARIFEPFFTTKAPGKGTGLGLPTIYGIVKQAGGAIYVYSEPGEGTSFKVYLPRVDVTPSYATKAGEITLRGRTILLLDDDADTNAVLSEYLREQGFTVLQAKTGQDAVQLCHSHTGSIDAFVSDVTMPGTDGQDIQGLLAIRHPRAKVIYISGFSSESLHLRGILPVDAVFLQKPFRFGDLYSKLEQVFTFEQADASEIGQS